MESGRNISEQINLISKLLYICGNLRFFMENTMISTELFKHLMEGKALSLTKREYFAAMALSGYVVNPDVSVDPEIAARKSVEYADALLAKLAESEAQNA